MEQKAFHKNKPLSCSSALCVWSLSGMCHSEDGHLVMSTKGPLTSFTLRRPAHNLFMFQDLHTFYCIPWTSLHTSYRSLHHTHTHKHTTQSLSPTPLPLHHHFCMWTTHTARCRYVTKLFFFQYSFTSVQQKEQKWKEQ